MAGIQLTEQRRSQLLEQLLSQQGQRPRIQSGAELAEDQLNANEVLVGLVWAASAEHKVH